MPALRLSGTGCLRHAAEEVERVDVRADPVRQRLRPTRLGIGVARRARAPRRTDVPRAPRPSSVDDVAPYRRPSRRTACRRPHASAASSATGACSTRCRARRSASSRGRRDMLGAMLLPQESCSVTPRRLSSSCTLIQSGTALRLSPRAEARRREQPPLQARRRSISGGDRPRDADHPGAAHVLG